MKSFTFLKVYIFEGLLIFECFILEITVNITVKQFTKCYFTIWFYDVIKIMGKRKEEYDTFLRKKQKKNKTLLPNDICR